MQPTRLILALAACVSLDGACADAPLDQPASGVGIVPTGNSAVALHGGYVGLFDQASGQCVEIDRALAGGTDLAVGAVSHGFELVYVETREELAREMGVDLGLKVKYLTAGGDLAVSLLDKFKNTGTTLSLLLKVEQDYLVQSRQPVVLRPAAAERLAAGAAAFVRACGSSYVSGVRYGGQLYLLLTYEADTREHARDVKTSLGVEGGFGPVQLDGDLSTKLTELASREGIRATLRVASRGFELDGAEANSTVIQKLIGSELGPDTFATIDSLRLAMQRSLDRDACRDAGDGACDGEPAPGYLDNRRRAAQVTGVELGAYQGLPGVLDPAPFQDIAARHAEIERFVRDWTALDERMTRAYQDQLAPLLAAEPSQQATFNVAPPGAPLRDPAALRAIAELWRDRFDPASGTIATRAQAAIATCWTQAAIDLSHRCGEAGARAETSAAWTEVAHEVETYEQFFRVAPLAYRVGWESSWGDADDTCAELATGGETYRLPTDAEVAWLAPLVGFGPITWEGDAANQIWIAPADRHAMCPDGDRPNPFFRNRPSDAAGSFGCGDDGGFLSSGMWLTTLCVPSGGPI